jgi:hypothetical protein
MDPRLGRVHATGVKKKPAEAARFTERRLLLLLQLRRIEPATDYTICHAPVTLSRPCDQRRARATCHSCSFPDPPTRKRRSRRRRRRRRRNSASAAGGEVFSTSAEKAGECRSCTITTASRRQHAPIDPCIVGDLSALEAVGEYRFVLTLGRSYRLCTPAATLSRLRYRARGR